MHKRYENGFHLLPVLAIVATIAVVGLIAWRVIGTIDDKKADFGAAYSNNCKERDVTFTSPPLKMDDLSYIRPMGAMLDGHVTPTDHVYVGHRT